MNPKTTIGLVVALLIAVIGVWWAQSSSSKRDTETKRPGPKALFDPPIGELAGFEVKAGDAPAFAFVMEDGKWRMTAPVSGPSEHRTVSGDVGKVTGLKYVKAYSKDDPDRPTDEMTSLNDPPRVVKLSQKEGGKSYVLKIGSRQVLSKKTYVQKEGDASIYLVDADLNQDLRRSLTDYRGKRVTEFAQRDAVRIEVTGEQQYTLVKSDGKWTVESPIKGRADAAKVSNLLRGVSSLSVMKFVEDAPKNLRPYGLNVPRLNVAVTTETKKEKPLQGPPASAPAEPEFEVETRTVRVAFGGTADDKTFAKIDEESSPAVFQVASSTLDHVGPPLNDVRDKKITTINTHRAQKIAISCEGESVELAKSDGKWRLTDGVEDGAGTEAEFAAVDDLLKAFRELKAIGFELEELPTYGFDQPRATIEVTAEGQLEPAKLVLGGLTPSKTGAYIRNEREGFIAVTKAEAAEALAVKPMSFLSREVLRFTRGQASEIELVRKDVTCALRREEGGGWAFSSPVEGRVEADAVDDVLSDLSNLRGRRVVGWSSEASSFGLDRPEVKVAVTVEAPAKPKKTPTTQPATQPDDDAAETPDPPTLHTILVGKHGDKVYAMAVGGMTICEVDGKVLDDLKAELFDRRVAEVETSDVYRLAFSGTATFTFERDGEDWVLQGEPSFATDPSQITKLCEALRILRAERYVRYVGAAPADYGLDQPAVVMTVGAEDGESLTLTISTTGPEEGGRYAAVSTAEGRVFVMKSGDVSKFTKQVQDFQKSD